MRQLFNWFRRRRLEDDLDRELRYHFDRRMSDLQSSGLSENEAQRKVRWELGGVTQVQEEVRDVWLTRWLRDLAYDLRFSLRSYTRTPSFAVTAVVSLMLGIGATTAIYSLVDQLLLHALPVREPNRLVLFDWQGNGLTSGFGTYNLMSYPICRDLDRKKEFFEGVFCRALTGVDLSTGGDQPSEVEAEVVSGNYFNVLGVAASLGRVFGDQDDGAPNSNPVVVLSYGFWKSQMGGTVDVIGRKLLVNQHPMTVIGVAAASFQGVDVGMVPSLWIPASMSSQVYPGFTNYLDRRTVWMQVLGRLRPGVTARQAQVGLQPWFKAMLHEDTRLPGFPMVTPQTRKEYFESTLTVTPAPLGHSLLRRMLVEPLWVLFCVSAVLLGLACLNVAGLFLARGSARDREISTRLALGASRGRLGRQLLADSLVIALTGGMLGTALAPLGVRTLLAFLPKTPAAHGLHSGVNTRLLLFALFASMAAGVLSGLAPAWHAGRRSVISSLGERAGTATSSVRLRKIIVTAQIALTLILTVGAALFIRTLDALMTKGPGFDTTSMVSFALDPTRTGYSKEQANRLMRQLNESIRDSPMTETSALASFPLLTNGSWNNPMTIQGRERVITDRNVDMNSITPGFFKTLGIHLLMGRNFDEHDRRPAGESDVRVAIVNQAFVKRYLPGQDPLGALICVGSGPDAKPVVPIVGVVSDFAYRDMRGNSEQAFFPFLEDGSSSGTFYLKVRGTPEQALRTVRNIVRQAAPALPITDFTTLHQQVDQSLNTEHLLATLSGSFGALALLLSLVGLYGVMAFVVTQRAREIGIRMALGAKQVSTIWLVLRDASVMILGGIAIGLPFVWGLGQLITSQLFDVKPSDPEALAAATLILSVAALAAAFIPAHRASSVNPVDALRID